MTNNRKLGCGCAAFCVIVIVLLGVYVVLGRPGAMIRGEMARIAREGAPFTLSDLDGQRLEDSQNGAVDYEKAFALLPEDSNSEDMQFLGRTVSRSEPIKDDAEWQRVRKLVAKYEGVVPYVEAAQRKVKCQFWIDYQNKGALGAEYTHNARLRDLSRIMCAKAIVSARDGNVDSAVRSLELAFGLNEALEYHPTLLATLVRYAFVNHASAATRSVLSCGNVSEAQGVELAKMLSSIDLSRCS